MHPSRIPPTLWPSHLAASVIALRRAEGPDREPLRAGLWRVLHAALFASLRTQAGRIAATSAEDLEDLASQKALELLLRAEEGAWDPGGRPDHEVAGYVARVARHALVDLARKRGREAPPPDDPEAWEVVVTAQSPAATGPEDEFVAREFALALRDCVATLAPRARFAWRRRVFLERPSREIAEALGIGAAHVDVVVQRARASLRDCMQSKGQADAEVRPGAVGELWWQMMSEPEHDGTREAAHDGP